MKKDTHITNQQYLAELISIQNSVSGVEVKKGTRKERLSHMREIFAQASQIKKNLSTY